MFVKTGDALLYSVAFGSPAQPALLAIGGWIGSWELWAEPFARLSQHWHVISYDHRGAGISSAPVDSITHATLVDDVFAIMDAHGIDTCVLAAESAGALTALGAALKQPQRISGLVIIDGAYYGEGGRAASPFAAGLRGAYDATLDAFVNACVPDVGSGHIRSWGRQLLKRAAPEAALALYLMPEGVDLRAQLPSITQSAVILHGADDQVLPVASSEQLARILPNATLQVIPACGHVPTMTHPDVVVDAINTAFLQRRA